jgi:hypothetical protein
MKKLYYVYSEATAEEDAFFDENFQLVHRWYGNDASFRIEYMSKLFAWAGVEVIQLNGCGSYDLCIEKLKQLFREEHGYDPDAGWAEEE